MKTKLHSCENAFYFSVWILGCLYTLCELFRSQTDVLERYMNFKDTFKYLNPGWRLIERLKDESDLEWSTWKYLVQTAWVFILLQCSMSEIIRRTYISALKYWYIFSSVTFIVLYMGIKQLLMVIIQPVIFCIIILLGGKRASIWVTGIVLLIGYNSLKYQYYFWYLIDRDNDEEVFVMMTGVAWVEIRCIIFSLDYIEKCENLASSQDTKTLNLPVFQHIVNMFSYVMYLPVLFLGPIIEYEAFEKSFNVETQNLSIRLKRFIWNMMIYIMYMLSLEFAFHYIYFIAMENDIKALTKLTSVALCGGGLWMGLEFHLKYVIAYGISTSFARLDNIDPPPTPRCIARIHLYSQMWRYFDVGLYRFLFKYIYIPVYNTVKSHTAMSKMSYKLLSSFATFLFIFTWHGTTWNIFIWSVLNYIGIILEDTGRAIGKTAKYVEFKEKVLQTDAMESRFIAFLCTPLLALSAISNFYLFAGLEVGNLYLGLMRSPSLLNCALIYFALYSGCHVSIAIQDVPSRTDFTKLKRQ